jgi:hypothetical protein
MCIQSILIVAVVLISARKHSGQLAQLLHCPIQQKRQRRGEASGTFVAYIAYDCDHRHQTFVCLGN